LLKSSQIRQNHFDSKTYQVFARLRESFTRVSFARFISFGLIGTAASIYLIQKYNYLQTLRSFFNAELPSIRGDLFKERKEMDLIKRILNPTLEKSTYYLIIGPHGCGKSTLVNFAARTFKKGIIYVEASDDIEKFGQNFAKAINYPKLDVNLVEWLANQLNVAKKYSIYPVLIIDDIAKIAKNDPKVVERLQNVAKSAADHGLYTVVFVASDANLIDNFITLTYLVNNRNFGTQIAKRIFDLCGGRIAHIIGAATEVDQLINLHKRLGKSVSYNDNEFYEEVIKAIEHTYHRVWDTSVPKNSKQSVLRFLCNNLDAEFTREDIVG
ncbi:5280_t:CDS:2, partial [Racocetra fulgida]